MGWIISVGKAGSKDQDRQQGGQVLSMRFDATGVPARIDVFNDAVPTLSQSTGAVPARQAQRIWRNVLATLTDTE